MNDKVVTLPLNATTLNRSWASPGMPVQRPRVAMSEDAIAYEFVTMQCEDVRYDHSRGSWFIWCGTHWRQDMTGEVLERVREFCASHAAGEEKESARRRLTSVKHAKNIEDFSKIDRRVAVTSDHWDADPFLLATPDGTVDLKIGMLREARPAEMISRLTAIGPRSTGCDQWLKFLHETCAGDQEQIDFLQKMAGYALTGDTREHALFFIYGPGGNGKGVFLNVLTGIMGSYAVTAPMETFTASKFQNHPTELAMLDGPRLVTASETEEGKRWAESRIKNVTGGDRLTARFMRENFFTFSPVFKLLIIGNHQPSLGVVDDAARRRFRMVPFENKPAQVDRELETKLKTEWPGILWWAVNGCIKWQKEGLSAPTKVQNATNRYFSEQDILQQWVDDHCEIDINSRCATDLAFASWSAFATAAGEYVGTKKLLTQRLDKKGFKNIVAKIDGKSTRVYSTLRLKVGNSL